MKEPDWSDPSGSQADPYPFWAEARRSTPVVARQAFGRASYTVHRWDDVEAALRDEDTFSSRINLEMMGPFMGEVILAKNGPEHSKHRNLVSTAFRPSAVARWERELIGPTIDALLDRLAPRGRADLVAEVTRRYPMRVIAGILGVPLDDLDQFMRWAEAVNLGPTAPEAGMAASRAMREYLRPIVEDRRAHPRDDLISDLLRAEVDGERLDDPNLYGFLMLLLPAGAETTFRVMGNCLYALLTHPRDLERVRSDRALLPEAIEETLRWETSVTMISRVATRDTRLAGVEIAAGSAVNLINGSANRDETRFDHSEEWDLDRPDKRHLAFGWGRHLCLGMHLARLELRAGIGAILDRLPGLRLDPAAPRPAIRGLAFRGPERLEVLFDPADPGSGPR
jgi:cytochrome P450